MSYFVNVQIDLLDKLEAETLHNSSFDFDRWAPYDTDRLEKIARFLRRAEANKTLESERCSNRIGG